MRPKIIIILIIMFLLYPGILVFSQEQAQGNKTDKAAEGQYKAAKQALFQKDWAAAVKQFREIVNAYPNWKQADESYYWLSYSLNQWCRTMENPNKVLEYQKQALSQLDSLVKHFPDGKWADDARLLKVEIAEDLVKRGFKEYKKILNGAAADPDKEMKIAALDALLNMDKEKAFPILEKIIRENKDPGLKKKAIFILSQTNDPRVVPLLVEVILNDADMETREKAIFWLGQASGPESLNELIKIYKKIPDVKLKEKLIFSISQHHGEAAIQYLMDIAKNDGNIRLQEKAIFWLGQKEGKKEDTAAFLFNLYSSSGRIELKEKIIFSLAQMGDMGVKHLLTLYPKEKNIELKKKIIFWLGQSNNEEARKLIEKILME